jgi:hypothetical protein
MDSLKHLLPGAHGVAWAAERYFKRAGAAVLSSRNSLPGAPLP